MKTLIIILFLLIFPVTGFGFDYILNDTTFYPSVQCTGVGTPYSWCTGSGEVPRPPKGTSYTDTVYHTEIVRVTDAATETIGGSSLKDYAQTGYPKHDIENSNGTMLLVQAEAGSGWYLYNALGVPQTIHGTEYPAFGKIRMIPINTIGYVGRQDCRWSRTDPNVFFYIGGLTRLGEQGKIVKYTIGVTDSVEVVYDTKLDSSWSPIVCTGVGTPVYWCTGVGTPSGYGGAGPTLQEEGDADSSGQYFAYAMSGPIFYQGSTTIYYKGAIVVDVTTGTLVSKILSLCPEFYGGGPKYSACLNPLWVQNPGYTTMSPSGGYVLFGDITKLYPRDFSTRYTYYVGNGHSDVAVDATGRDVWIGATHWQAVGDVERYWATMIDIKTGEVFHLAPIGPYSCNYHVSGNAYDKPGWALFSTFDASGDQSQWYVQQIMAIELTRNYPAPTLTNHAKTWRLADPHMVKVSYKDDTFAKFNKKGTKVWFTSGWHTSYSQIRTACDPPCQTNVFQITLPLTWWEDLGGLATSRPYSFLTSYSFTDAMESSIASKYSLIVTNASEATSATAIKTLQPTAKVLTYRDALFYSAHAADWITNTVTGNRVYKTGHPEWGYLHNPGATNFRTALAAVVASDLATYSQFDGVFLDDVLHDLTESEWRDEVTGLQPVFSGSDKTNWRSNMVLLLRACKTAIGAKLLIANTNFYRTDYIAEVDGIMDEWFAHPNWDNATTWLYDAYWKDSIDKMITLQASNKYFLAQSGVTAGATEVQIASISKFCFASFLMGWNGDYAKHYFIPTVTYSNYYWYDLWQTTLGLPLSTYAQIGGKNSYRRDFTGGVVIVNPSTNTEAITLEKAYLKDGVQVTSFNITGHEGVILLNIMEVASVPSKVQGLIIK